MRSFAPLSASLSDQLSCCILVAQVETFSKSLLLAPFHLYTSQPIYLHLHNCTSLPRLHQNMAPQPIGTKKVPATAQKKTAVTPVRRAPIATTRAVQPAKKPVPAPYKPHPQKTTAMTTTQKKPTTATAKKIPYVAPAKKTPPEQQGWLSRGLNYASSGIGNAAGAVVTATGNGVAGAGKGAGSSITNSTRSWADAVREYGNSVKDYTGAGGSRATTRTNPLGLTTSGVGASASMASRPGVTGSSVRTGTASNPLGL